MNRKLLWVILALLFTTVVVAQDLPIGLQKIIDYNTQSTISFSVKVSFLIAFIAGILGILSPCILPFLPAYFSYTFKEKKNITLMTLIFFAGFSIVFITMGVIAGYIGAQVLTVIQSGWLVTLAGFFIILMGMMTLFGKGFSSYLKFNHKLKNDIPGTFLLGIFFAAGWTACLGPILAGILGIGAILGNIWYSAALMFFYALGNFVPLFILSIFYDKLNLSKSKFMRGKDVKIGKFHVHSTNLISGVIFVLLGIVIVIFQGTGVFNTWDFLKTKQYFYSLQNKLIVWDYSNILGAVILIAFVAGLVWFFWKRKKK